MSPAAQEAMRVVVIGAGISGLACAFRLVERGADVTVLERAGRVGGVIASASRNGFLFELGPQSFHLNTAYSELIGAVGLESEVVKAPARAPRYVLAQGRLHPVPMGPQILVSGSLLGMGTRLRLIRDLAGRSAPPEQPESLAGFIRRKFGEQMLDRLAGPFVSGIYAGDPERLGLRDTFPDLYRWEKEQGSILRGAVRSMKARRESGEPRPTLSAMRGGNASLLEAVAAKLGGRVRLGTGVESVKRTGSPNGPGFELEVRGPSGAETQTADSVVMAAPADAAGRMLAALSPRIAEMLGRIEYAPVAVVDAGYRREQVKNPLDGFGFLVARSEGRKLLGTVWMSSLFPGRAPADCVNLATFIGGATDRSTTELAPEEIAAIVEKELGPILRISEPPVERMVNVHGRALPQYNVGHRRMVEEIRAEARRFAGLHFVGNYLDGPATGTCIEVAFRAAGSVLGGETAKTGA